jgi:hypothetical protein
MYFEKLIRITNEQKKELEHTKKTICHNGGNVSLNQLIRDSIEVFLDNCHEEAIKKYSPFYSWKKE